MTPAPVRVVLQPAEIMLAAQVGTMMTVQNIQQRRRGAYGVDNARDGWQATISGALGEAAVAKHLGLYWSGNIGRHGSTDVGPYQVRTTPITPPRLRLHDRDRDESVFILAHGAYGEYDLLGWTVAADGKHPTFWEDLYRNGRPAYWVPPEHLRDMRDLPDALAARGIEVAA